MKIVSAIEAKTHFEQFLDSVQREPVVVTKKDRLVAIMLPIEDMQIAAIMLLIENMQKTIQAKDATQDNSSELLATIPLLKKEMQKNTAQGNSLTKFKGKIKGFSNLDPVKWQQQIRSEWN